MISQLGRYEIVGELGHGAMGIVYKAKDPLIDRTLAIKTISLNLAIDSIDDYEARFYQEAKAAGRLSHPNIVTVFDVGKSGDVAYIAMEFLQGRELRDILNEGPRLPVSQTLDIVMQVALGLAYAHEHGIVHRDVKPSNIMVVRDGKVKITDFGIARMASSTVQTQVGVVLGSPKYMSPEQVLGKSIDQRSDIFSLGVMLYEMLTGQPPFVGDTINAVMYQTMNTVPPPPSTLNPEVPAVLNLIVTKALAKGLDERYQNAMEFADDLCACRDSLTRPGAKIESSKPQLAAPSIQIPGAATIPTKADAEETIPVAKIELTGNFNSFGATMRLAAMTASEDNVKTLKMARPSQEAIKQVAPKAAKPKTVAPAATKRTVPVKANQDKNAPQRANTSTLLLVMIILLILLGLAFIL